MGWQDWSYKLKGTILSLSIFVLIGILLFLLSPLTFMILFLARLLPNLITFGVFGFLIGWIIDSTKREESSTRIGLKVGIVISTAVIFFMFHECYYSAPGYPLGECFFAMNLISNMGYVWIVVSILLCTLIGWIIGKVRGK